MHIRFAARLLFVLGISVGVAACTGIGKTQPFESRYTFTSATGAPLYSSIDYWAAHPAKWDPSDSIPAPIRKQYVADTSVDVFFIHPTTYTAAEKSFGPNAPVDNAALNALTDYRPILYQASAFNRYNVYAPRYRQAHLSNYHTSDLRAAKTAFGLAYQDVKAAFTHYLTYYNKGRPFIIASHSQGTTHARRLLQEMVDGQPIAAQMVAAYLVGIPVPTTELAAIPLCPSPGSTGCVVSWRTMQTGYLTPYASSETEPVLIVNPLTFDTAIPKADRSKNLGSLMPNFNKLLAGRVNAEVHNNVLWADKPSITGAGFMDKDYHVADYNFYWMNIRQNVAERVAAYKALAR